MKKLREIIRGEILKELADGTETYNYRWNFPVGEKAPDGTIENYAHFESASGMNYKIKINGWKSAAGTYTMRVDFGTRSMGDDLTGQGEPFKILGTIVEATKEAIESHGDVTKLEISSAGPRRAKIYDRILKRKVPNAKQVDRGNGYITYEI